MRAARPHYKVTSTSAFARETGIARNRNCLACKSPRKSGAGLVDGRRFLEIARDVDHLQRGAWLPFRDAIQNGKSTLAKISATRDSPISAIAFGDALAVSV